MKEWWMNLALREKYALILGSALLGLFLLYEILWAPFANTVNTLREDIPHRYTLLRWMKESDQQLQSLANETQNITEKTAKSTNASLFTDVQDAVNASPIAKHMTQLRQGDNNVVQLHFQSVGFDALITWLTHIWQSDGILVSQIDVKPVDAIGLVDSSVTLTQ